MVLFLGRSIDGILADARSAFPGKEITIVARDDDQLQSPEGFNSLPVSEFKPEEGVEYTVVANGGTAAQLVPVLLRLARANVPLRVFDLQRDGVRELV